MIDDVLTEHGGPLHVVPLAVHLDFFYGQVQVLFEVFLGDLSFILERYWVVVVGGGWWPTAF